MSNFCFKETEYTHCCAYVLTFYFISCLKATYTAQTLFNKTYLSMSLICFCDLYQHSFLQWTNLDSSDTLVPLIIGFYRGYLCTAQCLIKQFGAEISYTMSVPIFEYFYSFTKSTKTCFPPLCFFFTCHRTQSINS